MNVIQFRKQNPVKYQEIINLYGGRSNIFDIQAAILMYQRGDQPPVCDICKKSLSIIKQYRIPRIKFRCSKHVNTNVILDRSLLDIKNIHNYSIIKTADIITPTSSLILECSEHGRYKQSVSHFLKGMRCQKCFIKTIGPKIDKNKWMQRSNQIHNNFYDYSESNFINLTDQINVRCPIHGTFIQNAGVHMRGHGCSECMRDKSKKRLLYSLKDFINFSNQKHNSKYDYTKTHYNGARSSVTITCPEHGDFNQIAYYHLSGNGCHLCGKQQSYKSKEEFSIINFLKENGIKNIIHSYQSLGIEVDIFLPDYNIGIEYDGIYWHSSSSKDDDWKYKNKHLYKTEICESNGIQLLHIFENEWLDERKKEIWKSVILNKLNLSYKKIYARNCEIITVENKIAKEFFENNHLQGFVTGKTHIGLRYQDELISLATFSKTRFRKNQLDTFELLRFASKKNTSIIGGFGKIIKRFKDTHSGILISYANRRWSCGKVYKIHNFELEKINEPCYYYTDTISLWSRMKFQKHKLENVIDNFNKNSSEVENMYNNGYRRIWDSGHLVYKLKIG